MFRPFLRAIIRQQVQHIKLQTCTLPFPHLLNSTSNIMEKFAEVYSLLFRPSPGVQMWLAEHISELPVSSVFRWNRTGVPKRRREPTTSIHWVKTKKTKEWNSDRGKRFNTSAQLFVYQSISLFFDSAVVFIRHIHNSSTQSYPGNIPTSDHLP